MDSFMNDDDMNRRPADPGLQNTSGVRRPSPQDGGPARRPEGQRRAFGQTGPRPGRPLPPPPRPGQRPGGQALVPDRQTGPAGGPARRAESMRTRPLEPYPGYTPSEPRTAQSRPQRRQSQKKRSALPFLLGVLVIVAIGVAAFFLLSGKSGNAEEEIALREKTNQYRLAVGTVQDAVDKTFSALHKTSLGLAAQDNIEFVEDKGERPTFVDNALTFEYVEKQHPTTMGRLVIPSIGTNGPLCADSTDDTLYYGFGIVPFMKDMSEEGLNVILGHRVLTKEAGMLYMGEMQENDPFYIDDYRIGKRYIYNTRINENVTEETYLTRFVTDGYEPLPGQISMLVTCDPFVYAASERRILVYGEVTSIIDIPEDDAFYIRYKTENGIS